MLDFLVARCDLRLDRPEEASLGFEAAVAVLPALREVAAADRADAAARSRDWEAADRWSAEVGPGEPRFPRLQTARARRALRAERPADALRALAEMSGHLTWQSQLARAARLRADAERAIDQNADKWWRTVGSIFEQWPYVRAGRVAEIALQERLKKKRDVPVSTGAWLDEAIRRAKRRIRDRGETIVEALERGLGARATGAETLVWGEVNHRRSPFLVWDRLEDLDGVVEPTIRDRLDDLRARTLRRMERYGDALKIYRRLALEASTDRARAEALWEGGRLQRKLARVSEARWWFDRLLARHRHDLPEKRARALWELAWIAWREGQLEESDTYLQMLMDEHTNERDRSRRTWYERALYWRGRIHAKRGRSDEARRTWSFLVERFPLTWYSTLASNRLAMLAPDETAPPGGFAPDDHAGVDPGAVAPVRGSARAASSTPAPPLATEPPTLADLRPVEPSGGPAAALVRAGLLREARERLQYARRRGTLGQRSAELLSALHRRADDPAGAHWILKAVDPLDVSPEGPERGRWLAAFPRPYPGLVHPAAREMNVDPLLVWSMMRQESGFRTRAQSHANALGLMQVLHGTGKVIARKILREPAPSRAGILQPATNVRYGAAYIRYLLDRYGGHPVVAVAGYNAGPGNADRWLRRYGQLPTDEWVEEITFDEARAYARTVMQSYATYRALYGGEPLVIPQWLPGRKKQEAEPGDAITRAGAPRSDAPGG